MTPMRLGCVDNSNTFRAKMRTKKICLHVQTLAMITGLICVASFGGVESLELGLGSLSSLGAEHFAARVKGVVPLCKGNCGARDLTRGDVGHLQLHKLFVDHTGATMELVKSRKKRYMAFPDGSTLSLETKITMPAASYNNGNQVLKKLAEYTFVIKLPTEKILFTGLKNMFISPGSMNTGYGPPKGNSVIQGPFRNPVSASTSYGSPPSSAPAPEVSISYGRPLMGAPPLEPMPMGYGPPVESQRPGPISDSYGTTFSVQNSDEDDQDDGETSSYSLQKDLDSIKKKPPLPLPTKHRPLSKGEALPTHGYHFGVYEDHDQTAHFNTTFEEQEQHQQHVGNHAQQQAMDVVMSSLDHQRLLGFLSIEKTFDSAGLPGRWCVLKAVCEVAADPMDDLGLMGEMINLFLAAGYGDGSPALLEYVIAEEVGITDGDCDRHFGACQSDLTGLLTAGATVLTRGLTSASR